MDDDQSSNWPEDIHEAGRQISVEIPSDENDMFEELTINKEPNVVDFKHPMELTNYSDKGKWQLATLVRNWEHKQANAVRLLREELYKLSKQQHQDVEILEERRFDINFQEEEVKIDAIEAEYDSVVYWKQRALSLEKLLEASVRREQVLLVELQERIENLERQSSPVEELSHVLKREDNFLHFVLQNAPVVIGHQDKELRYRFIYNYFPSLEEGDVIGKTDEEVFTGAGIKESQDFKREVLKRGLPAKREITFKTELFGSKTFLMCVEPVYSKDGETIGVNYIGMEVTDQVRKREKMAKIREEMAVQKAKETELNKTIHIQGLIIAKETELNKTIHIQGVMKLETTKFRPREVVKHVLQTAAASQQKLLTVEGHVADDIPVEVIGDVLWIRQILKNLVSNAIKFTHEGKVGINLYVVPDPTNVIKQDSEGERIVWIRCDVYDTGIGIPEHAMPTLFKKYMQVGGDTAREYNGTGLGLAICKRLVELMGGDLTVSSVEHQGSTFTFVLPYKVSSISDDPDEPSGMYQQEVVDDGNDGDLVFLFQPRALGSLFSSQLLGDCSSPSSNITYKEMSPEKVEAKPKILLVEDNKINATVAKSLMMQLGHSSIDVVNNGAEAVLAVLCESYDLVLMDVCMPVMGGVEATRLIRLFEETGCWDEAVNAGIVPPSVQRKPGKRIPIIAMTANVSDCVANGMDSFVLKPVTFQDLKQCLQKYLPQHSLQ